jgi:hypothetical protein
METALIDLLAWMQGGQNNRPDQLILENPRSKTNGEIRRPI